MAVAPRRVLITGASGGIGRAFARQLAREHDLLLTGRDDGALGRIADELAGAGRRIDTLAADLGTHEGTEAVIAAAMRTETLTGVINNAGAAPTGRFLDTDPDAIAATVDVNCRATAVLTHALLPALLTSARSDGRRGFVLNVASTVAYAPVPRLAIYAASKAFVLSLTEALATELRGEPIDVLALCPGPTRTASLPFDFLPGTSEPEAVARIALDQLGRRTVAYTDLPTRATLTPLTCARVALSRALDAGLRLTMRR